MHGSMACTPTRGPRSGQVPQGAGAWQPPWMASGCEAIRSSRTRSCPGPLQLLVLLLLVRRIARAARCLVLVSTAHHLLRAVGDQTNGKLRCPMCTRGGQRGEGCPARPPSVAEWRSAASNECPAAARLALHAVRVPCASLPSGAPKRLTTALLSPHTCTRGPCRQPSTPRGAAPGQHTPPPLASTRTRRRSGSWLRAW